MFNVFISSTYEDLKSYRAEVRELVSALGLVDIAMESWPPGATPPREMVNAAMQRSDIYVGILAWRYGSRMEGDLAYTEYEYQLAKELHIPRLIFLHDPEGQWPVRYVDTDEDGGALRKLRAEIMRDPDITWKYFRKEMDLVRFLSGGLFRLITTSNKYQTINPIERAILAIRQRTHEDLVTRRSEIDYSLVETEKKWFISEVARCNVGKSYVSRQSLRNEIAGWFLENSSPFLFLLGAAGSGKTNFLITEIIFGLVGAETVGRKSLPVQKAVMFLSLGSYDPEISFWDNFEPIAAKCQLTKETVRQLIISGAALLIADGLDEFVRNHGEEQCVALFAEINEAVDHASSKVIVSCRDHIYERLVAAGTLQAMEAAPSLLIPPLSSEEVKRLVQQRLGKTSPVYSALTVNQALVRFAQSPLLLEMMCRMSADSWKRFVRVQTMGSLYDLWFQEIISTSASPAEALLDEFVPDTLTKVGRIAGIMLRKRSDLISVRELNDSGLMIDDLRTLTRQPFGIFIKQTPSEWGFVHDSFREFALARTTAIELTSSSLDLLASTSSFDYVGAETYRFLRDILPRSHDLFEHVQAALTSTRSETSVWNNVVRNCFEAIGMIGEETEEEYVDKAVDILMMRDAHAPTDSVPTLKTQYNLARALERMHRSSARPYYQHVLNKGWGSVPSWSCFGAAAVRGFHATEAYVDWMPPMVYRLDRNASDGLRQREVSSCLVDLLSDSVQGGTRSEQEFLQVNVTYALIRWLHIDHLPDVMNLLGERSICSLALGNLFHAFLRFKQPELFDGCASLFSGMQLCWVYLSREMLPEDYIFTGVVFHKYHECRLEGFAPSSFSNCEFR